MSSSGRATSPSARRGSGSGRGSRPPATRATSAGPAIPTSTPPRRTSPGSESRPSTSRVISGSTRPFRISRGRDPTSIRPRSIRSNRSPRTSTSTDGSTAATSRSCSPPGTRRWPRRTSMGRASWTVAISPGSSPTGRCHDGGDPSTSDARHTSGSTATSVSNRVTGGRNAIRGVAARPPESRPVPASIGSEHVSGTTQVPR